MWKRGLALVAAGWVASVPPSQTLHKLSSGLSFTAAPVGRHSEGALHQMHHSRDAPRRRWIPVPVVDFDAGLQARLSGRDVPVVSCGGTLHERLSSRDVPADLHAGGSAVGSLHERLSARDVPADSHAGAVLHERLTSRDVPADRGVRDADDRPRYVGVHEVVRRHERLLSEDVPTCSGKVHEVVHRQERLHAVDVPAQRSCLKRGRLSSGDVPVIDSAEGAEDADAGGADCVDQQVRLPPGDVPVVYRRIPRTERYMVRRPMVNDILMRLRAGTPSVDGFGDSQLHVWPRWWGPGSAEAQDAFGVYWGNEPLLWLNPPFTMLNAVVNKLREDHGVAILIMPHWCNQHFYEAIKPFVKRKHYYDAGTKLFETESGPVGGTAWPVWALYVDCRDEGWQPTSLELQKERTRSSTRRWRQRWKAQTLC